MIHEIRTQISAIARALCHHPSGPGAANSCCPGIGRCEMDAAITEIARLRADRNAEISARMKAEGEFSTMQRRIARQRRALSKMYKHRHDKNAEIARLRAALATARREGIKDVAKWHEVRSMELSGKAGLARNFRQLLRQSDFHMEIAAAIRAAAKEGKP